MSLVQSGQGFIFCFSPLVLRFPFKKIKKEMKLFVFLFSFLTNLKPSSLTYLSGTVSIINYSITIAHNYYIKIVSQIQVEEKHNYIPVTQ